MKSTLQNFKLILLLLSVGLTGILFSSCEDDEKPKTVPVVTTSEITGITTTTAMGGGEITDEGNSEITVVGLVYSSAIAEPTLADSKTETTLMDNSFTSLLETLHSGTVYYVRAYATNAIGTAFGDVVQFTTGNAAPVATAVTITGTLEANKEVTGTYTYTDAESNAESGSTFQWYVANDAAGTGEAAIAGATSKTYLIAPTYEGKYLSFGVTPKAAAGTTTGVEVKSNRMGGVGEATTVTFVYNNVTVTYGIITSTTTQKKWLDRNLGAPNVPTAFDNYQNYGDLFQWGRKADGHQLITRNGNSNSLTLGVNVTTTTLSTSDEPGHSLFIVNGAGESNWREPTNRDLWQGVSGKNNPCPQGWRIPTSAEWEAEEITSGFPVAFDKLKLTLGGKRSVFTGNFSSVSSQGRYWSSSYEAAPSFNFHEFNVATGASAIQFAPTGEGMSCRCIKN